MGCTDSLLFGRTQLANEKVCPSVANSEKQNAPPEAGSFIALGAPNPLRRKSGRDCPNPPEARSFVRSHSEQWFCQHHGNHGSDTNEAMVRHTPPGNAGSFRLFLSRPGLAPTSQTDTRQRLGGLPARRWELRVICYIANPSPAETRRCLEWRRSLGGPHQVRRRRLDCHQVRRRRFDWRACETRPHIDWWRAIARPLRRIRPVPDEILFVMEIDGPE